MPLGAAPSSDVSGSDVDKKKTNKRDQFNAAQLQVGNNMAAAMHQMAEAMRRRRSFVEEFKTNAEWLQVKLKLSDAVCAEFNTKYPEPVDLASLTREEVFPILKDDVLTRRWATMRALYD